LSQGGASIWGVPKRALKKRREEEKEKMNPSREPRKKGGASFTNGEKSLHDDERKAYHAKVESGRRQF